MYHAIVRRRVVGLFDAVSNGNARSVLEGLAPRFEHFFLGDHALGGSRFTLEKTRLWYERLYRLLPDISFDLRAIRISGPPWNTLVAVDWLESNSGTDGVRTSTPGVHVVRLAWGRMTYIGIYPDTVGVVTTLQRLSRAGVAEATAFGFVFSIVGRDYSALSYESAGPPSGAGDESRIDDKRWLVSQSIQHGSVVGFYQRPQETSQNF